MSPIETAVETVVTRSRPLQSTPATTITTAVVSSWVECRRETCTVVTVHVIGTHTVTQCATVFEERRSTRGANTVGGAPVADVRPTPVMLEEGR
jgi:hypothetical protein